MGWDLIRYINSRDHPLVLYVFSKQKNITDLFVEQTRSGSISMNDTIMFYGGKNYVDLKTKHFVVCLSDFLTSKFITPDD